MFPLNDIDLLRVALEVGGSRNKTATCRLVVSWQMIAGNILERAENTVITDNDTIAHCEINLVHQLAGKYGAGFLSTCTIYAGTEPCPMCMACHLLEWYRPIGICTQQRRLSPGSGNRQSGL